MLASEVLRLQQIAVGQPRFTVPQNIFNRDPKYRAADQAALKALAQAAVNVELFTIPLYMCAMTSLAGTHEINAAGVSYYQGRTWPGRSTSAVVNESNARAYNAVFAVFIEEMLHLQLAANMASAIGVAPTFTSPLLQTPAHGWTCYGPGVTVIPHIVRTTDLVKPYEGLPVSLAGLTKPQLQLFCVIEQPHDRAYNTIDPDKRDNYFPTVPFANWTQTSTEADLPLFGTIGYMYWCYLLYCFFTYNDGSTLLGSMYVPDSVQRDLFNTPGGGRLAEYPGIVAQIPAGTSADAARLCFVNMMLAISDQGEGFSNHPNVFAPFRPDDKALAANYPSYTASGKPAPVSSTLVARGGDNGGHSHFELFKQLLELDDIVTFETWFAQGHRWSAADLQNGTGWSSLIPAPQVVADALNEMHDKANEYRPVLDAVASGAIAGVTTVLDTYWSGQTDDFPFPSMSGSGDRMALYWAAIGQAPRLSGDTGTAQKDVLYNACQGLNLAGHESESCANLTVAHTCKGSNGCMAQGGCGFVHAAASCGLCGTTKGQKSTMDSAPTDNKCSSFGGCAVPISAAQLFPTAGTMELYDFKQESPSGPYTPEKIDATIDFHIGDSVYETAWEAYCKILESRDKRPKPKPPVSTLRNALPPST